MTYQTTPIKTVTDEVYEILDEDMGVTVYPELPIMGIDTKCVVMTLISGSTSGSALGEVVSSTAKGQRIRLLFQFDCYHDDPVEARSLADLLLYTIWSHRTTLRNHGIGVEHSTRIQDLPEREVGARLYRKSLDYAFTIEETMAI